MKTTGLPAAIQAHLRATGGALSSRDLAARFLRIEHGDEEVCRRLLAPFLGGIPGVSYRPGDGWICAPPRTPAIRVAGAPEHARPEATAAAREASPLRDYVALATDGAGPGGSGAPRTVSLLPVVAGEECDEEHLPSWALDDEGPAGIETAIDAGPATRPVEAAGLGREELQALAETVGDLPVVCHRAAREVEPLRRACADAGLPFHPRVISAARLGHLLLGLKANHAAWDLGAALGVQAPGPDDCRGRVRLVSACYLRLAAILEERGIDTLEALIEYQNMPPEALDLSRYAFSAEDLKAIPALPGVYRFLDREGRVIYVGKARNLRLRVGTYFAATARGSAKGRAILDQVHSFRVEPVASELEAVLLEAALISEHRPPLNRQFEVHERPAPYGPRLNLVVVLRDAPAAPGAAPSCTLHLVRRGGYLGRVPGVATPPAASGASRRPKGRASGRPDPWSRAVDLVAAAYFPSPGTDPAGAAGVDVDWQLVATFVRRHRDAVSVLDVDECATAAEAQARLRTLVQSVAAAPGRVLAR